MGHVSTWARSDNAEEGAPACGCDWATAGKQARVEQGGGWLRREQTACGGRGGVQESSPRPPPSKVDGQLRAAAGPSQSCGLRGLS